MPCFITVSRLAFDIHGGGISLMEIQIEYDKVAISAIEKSFYLSKNSDIFFKEIDQRSASLKNIFKLQYIKHSEFCTDSFIKKVRKNKDFKASLIAFFVKSQLEAVYILAFDENNKLADFCEISYEYTKLMGKKALKIATVFV